MDRNHRREGVAAVALDGALDLIARAGGGVVEAYPQDTAGKKGRMKITSCHPSNQSGGLPSSNQSGVEAVLAAKTRTEAMTSWNASPT